MHGERDVRQPDQHKVRAMLTGRSVTVIAAVIVGVGVYLWQQSAVKKLEDEAARAQDILRQEIDELHAQSYRNYPVGEAGEEHFFKVYGQDRQAMLLDGEVNFYVAIPETLSSLEKLRLLADRLSRFRFRYLPIDVMGVEERDGKMIGIINLKETEQYRNTFAEWLSARRRGDRDKEPRLDGPSWRTGYFQGSTGGHFTTITLIKTFLQEDYTGHWIDGVEFQYEGEPIGGWDHISLSGTRYRGSKRTDPSNDDR